jgi:hypothetical protein
LYSSYPTDRIISMFGSSLPPVVCRRVHVLFVLFMFVCLCIVVSNTHCVLFCFLCFFWSSSGCQFLWNVHFWLIAPSIFSKKKGNNKITEIRTSYDENVQLILKSYLSVVYGTPLINNQEKFTGFLSIYVKHMKTIIC